MVRNAPIAASDETTQMNPSQRDSMVTKKKVGSGSITRIVDGTSAKRPWPAAMLPRRPINKTASLQEQIRAHAILFAPQNFPYRKRSNY